MKNNDWKDRLNVVYSTIRTSAMKWITMKSKLLSTKTNKTCEFPLTKEPGR